MITKNYMTGKGHEKYCKELKHLKEIRRAEILHEIKVAKEHGDLSENAEYDAAKDAQANNEIRIANLEQALISVQIIEDMDIPADKIYIGAAVTLINIDTDEEVVYTLLSSLEADPNNNIISVVSPIGKALLGNGVGDVVDIETPKQFYSYEVKKIERKF